MGLKQLMICNNPVVCVSGSYFYVSKFISNEIQELPSPYFCQTNAAG